MRNKLLLSFVLVITLLSRVLSYGYAEEVEGEEKLEDKQEENVSKKDILEDNYNYRKKKFSIELSVLSKDFNDMTFSYDSGFQFLEYNSISIKKTLLNFTHKKTQDMIRLGLSASLNDYSENPIMVGGKKYYYYNYAPYTEFRGKMYNVFAEIIYETSLSIDDCFSLLINSFRKLLLGRNYSDDLTLNIPILNRISPAMHWGLGMRLIDGYYDTYNYYSSGPKEYSNTLPADEMEYFYISGIGLWYAVNKRISLKALMILSSIGEAKYSNAMGGSSVGDIIPLFDAWVQFGIEYAF